MRALGLRPSLPRVQGTPPVTIMTSSLTAPNPVSCIIGFYIGSRWKLPPLHRKLPLIPRKLPPLPWKRMTVSTKAVEASTEALEASMEASMDVHGGYHRSFRGSAHNFHGSFRESCSMELLWKWWKLPREVWSTTTNAIPPEASGCFHESFNHHFLRQSQTLLRWKLVLTFH